MATESGVGYLFFFSDIIWFPRTFRWFRKRKYVIYKQLLYLYYIYLYWPSKLQFLKLKNLSSLIKSPTGILHERSKHVTKKPKIIAFFRWSLFFFKLSKDWNVKRNFIVDLNQLIWANYNVSEAIKEMPVTYQYNFFPKDMSLAAFKSPSSPPY